MIVVEERISFGYGESRICVHFPLQFYSLNMRLSIPINLVFSEFHNVLIFCRALEHLLLNKSLFLLICHIVEFRLLFCGNIGNDFVSFSFMELIFETLFLVNVSQKRSAPSLHLIFLNNWERGCNWCLGKELYACAKGPTQILVPRLSLHFRGLVVWASKAMNNTSHFDESLISYLIGMVVLSVLFLSFTNLSLNLSARENLVYINSLITFFESIFKVFLVHFWSPITYFERAQRLGNVRFDTTCKNFFFLILIWFI